MRGVGIGFLLVLGISLQAVNQRPSQSSSEDKAVMLAAVSRDDSMLTGGLGSGRWTGRGTVVVEPLASLTPSGEWVSVPCDPSHPATCRKFERDYLSRPHTYTVISADGRGATVQATPIKLDECSFFIGAGTYAGASIANSAIAASSTELFDESEPPRLLGKEEGAPVRKALTVLVPGKLDPALHLRLYSLRLEDKDLVIVQWTTVDFIDKPGERSTKRIFAIGSMDQGRFHLLHWKQNTEDEDERVIGTILLKSGRGFLITTAIDPESQRFRVYGIRDGRLVMVYSGGGSSC